MFYPCRIVLPIILNSREDFPVNASHTLRFPSNILPKFISRKREAKEQTNSCPSSPCQLCLLSISPAYRTSVTCSSWLPSAHDAR